MRLLTICTALLTGAVLLLSGCSTQLYHADGTPWIRTYANATSFSAGSGSDYVVITGMNHSTPTTAGMNGVNKNLATVGGAFVASTFGGGTMPTVGKAAVLAVPHITTSTKAAKPLPKPAEEIWP